MPPPAAIESHRHPRRHQDSTHQLGRGLAHILERAVERGQRAKHPRLTPHLGVDEKAIAEGTSTSRWSAT